MTNEKAIDLLILDIAVSKAGVKHCHNEVGVEALRMAINALRQQALRTGIKALEQEPKTGRWMHPYKSDIACECSECHMQMPITKDFNYCPN
jgi:hypothetical protein